MNKRYLSLKDCLGLDKIDRKCYATPPPYAPNVQNQTVSYGGATWKGEPGGSWRLENSSGGGGGMGASIDPIETAKKLRQFTIESNQPAIQSYQASKAPLEERYKNVLNQIKGNQTISEEREKTNVAREYGKRGIPLSSGVYDQAVSQAINPISQAYTGMYQDSLASQNIDLSNIDKAIALLQSGNPESAISGALGFTSNAQQAEQSSRNYDLALQQLALQKETANKTNLADQYLTLGEGSTLYDLLGGKALYTAPKSYKGTGSGNLPDLNTIFG